MYRYEFCMLCSDKTGSIPVLWSAEELTRFTGKTIYDVLADETEVTSELELLLFLYTCPSLTKHFSPT